MHRKVAAALVAVLALGLASCGSSQKTETVSRAQLISRLEAACLAGQRAAKAQPNGETNQAAYLNGIIANLRTIDEKVGHLETTGAAKPFFDTYKASLAPRIEALEKILSADSADRQQVIRTQRDVISTAGERGHTAFLRIGARHICM